MTSNDIPAGAALLTLAQVAELVQVTDRTIRRMVSADQFPRPIALGRGPKAHKRWSRREVQNWIDERLEGRKGA